MNKLLFIVGIVGLAACGKAPVDVVQPLPTPPPTPSPQSTPAPTGSPTSVTSGFNCVKSSGAFTVSYKVVKYQDGQIDVDCTAKSSAGSNTNSVHYSKTDNQQDILGCYVYQDAEGNGSNGWWNFTSAGGFKHAQYNDSTSASNHTVIGFGNADCQLY